jgi:hypothetical protein
VRRAWFFAIVPGVIAGIVLIFILALFLIKLVWAWAIPDLFPGAVEQGLVAANISWYTSFKLAILVAVLGAFTRQSSRGNG